MDLLELNDIYCKDKVRTSHNKLFDKDLDVEYAFVPTEDKTFSSGSPTCLDAVINHPFRGACSKVYPHDLSKYTEFVNDIECTSYYDNQEDFNFWMNMDERIGYYEGLRRVCLQYHPDILFTDQLPGLTVVMSSIRNQNNYFERIKGSVPPIVPKYVTDAGLPVDSRALSMIYNMVDGTVKYGYGPMIYFGRGITSLSYEMRAYLLSSAYLICRGCDFEGDPNDDEHKGWHNLRTVCLVLYEDSLKRINETIAEEK